MKRHLIIIILAMVGLFLGANGYTQNKKGPEVKDKTIKTAEGQRINAFMVEKIVGSEVVNVKGEKLGKIENLVVDIDSGRILYAVLESGGFLGIGDKLFPSLGNPLQRFHQKAYSSSISRKNKWKKHLLLRRTSCQTWGTCSGERAFSSIIVSLKMSTGDMERVTVMAVMVVMAHYGYPMHPNTGREELSKKIFDSKTIKTISGQVIKVDRVPESGSGMEMRLTVFIDKKEVLPVYLGPAFYIVGSEEAKPL